MSIRLLSSRRRTIICCGIELFIAAMLVCQYICGWRFVWAWHFTLDDMDKLIYLGRMSNRNTMHQFVNICFSLEHITVALCQNWKKEIPLSVMPKLWESTMTRVFSPRVFDKLSPMANGLAEVGLRVCDLTRHYKHVLCNLCLWWLDNNRRRALTRVWYKKTSQTPRCDIRMTS